MNPAILTARSMRQLAAFFLLALLSAAPASAERKLIASEIKGAAIQKPGKIVITNDQHSITAYQFHADVKTALFRLKSSRSLRRRFFGSELYDSTAPLTTPVPETLAPIIREAAAHHGVDPRLVAAVARRESRFSSRAVSPVGARGIMQLMPSTAELLGVSDSFDPRQNIFGGARYLKMLLDTFQGDLDLTLAAYNAGPGAVRKYQGVPPYRETLAYVAAIRSDYESSLR